MKQSKPIGWARESQYLKMGFDLVVGADEAGRGPLAGPVVAGAAAVFDFNADSPEFEYLLGCVRDSKKISASKREEIYKKIIICKNLAWGAGRVGNGMIDKINILEASKWAMAKAIANLVKKLPKVAPRRIICLVDGNFSIPVPYFQQSIVGGDAKVFSIAAASIIAKVIRDRIMVKFSKIYPAYGFSRHKGYPTKDHLAAIARNGLTPIHRRSFSPCANAAIKDIIK